MATFRIPAAFPLAELLGVLDRQRMQPQTGTEPVDDLIGRVLDVQPERLA
jgi:hypothetical protein